MQRIEWTEDFEIGIQVIDSQHQRIVQYINTLVDIGEDVNQEEVARLIDSLIDYTVSHFAFEESLMEEAGYEFITLHKGSHKAFARRIKELYFQFKDGNDVSTALGPLLQAWLHDHILNDDKSYAPLVRQKLQLIEKKHDGNWVTDAMRRYFGSKNQL